MMKKIESFRTLEEGILLIQQKAKHRPISIKEILHLLPEKGRALVLIFLSLPFCQPLQIPGLSTPFGLIVAFIGLRMAFGKHVWLPKRILSKKISSHALQQKIDKVLLIVRKMKHWTYPGLNWACHSFPMLVINGIAIFILGILLALPLPVPFSNLIAAWPIFLIALGILEDNGIFVLMGHFVLLLAIAFFVVVALSVKRIF